MMKLLHACVLGLAVFATGSAAARAGTFGLFTGGCCCKCCGGCAVCIRPYNAFTPVVSGHLTADGCFPFSGGGGGGCGMGGFAEGGPLCAIGETCASVPTEGTPMAAAEYQQYIYQQQLAAQYMMYQQQVQQQMNAGPAMPYTQIQMTGYGAGYNGGAPMLQQVEPFGLTGNR